MQRQTPSIHKREHDEGRDVEEDAQGSQQTQSSWASAISARDSLVRRDAYHCMLGNGSDEGWGQIMLLSTDGHHTTEDREL